MIFFFNSREHLDCCTRDTSLHCPYLVGPSEGDSAVIENMAGHAEHCGREESVCKKRKRKEEDLLSSCDIDNPLFLPSSRVYAEVIVI